MVLLGTFWYLLELFETFRNIAELLSVGTLKLRSLRSILQSPLVLWTPIWGNEIGLSWSRGVLGAEGVELGS